MKDDKERDADYLRDTIFFWDWLRAKIHKWLKNLTIEK